MRRNGHRAVIYGATLFHSFIDCAIVGPKVLDAWVVCGGNLVRAAFCVAILPFVKGEVGVATGDPIALL